MKHKIFLRLIIGLIILSIFSTLVFAADNAPPPIPTEYWGRALVNGEQASVGTPVTSSYGNTTVTAEGYYDVILTGGDSPLTCIADPTCATHWAAGEACITCSTNPADPNYCIEGPQNGNIVAINFNGAPVDVIWGDNKSLEENILTLYQLYAGWNMISMPVKKEDTSIQSYMGKLTGQKVAFHYDASDLADHWKGYDSSTPPFTWDLLTLEPKKGYWLKLDSAQNLAFIGKVVQDTSIPLKTGWNMVGFLLYKNTIETAMAGLTGQKVAFHYDASDLADHWKGYDSTTPPFTWDLTNIKIGRGYWLKVGSDQTWEGS